MLDQLRADLAVHADISDGDGSGSGWVIARYDREMFSPAVLFTCTEEDLAQCLEASSTDAAFLFADVPARVAAYRLLLVHLEEALLSMTPPTEVHVTAEGVRVTGASSGQRRSRAERQAARGRSWVAYPPDQPAPADAPARSSGQQRPYQD